MLFESVSCKGKENSARSALLGPADRFEELALTITSVSALHLNVNVPALMKRRKTSTSSHATQPTNTLPDTARFN